MRIGINSGVLSVGSFGSRGRMTYTAIGLQANIAARIQTQCEPGGILLSDASWHLVKDQVRASRAARSSAEASTTPCGSTSRWSDFSAGRRRQEPP